MKKFNVGLQLYSVKNAMAKDFYGTLRAVRDMGYEYVEFAGYFDKSAEEIKAALKMFGRYSQYAPTYLGLNKSESMVMHSILCEGEYDAHRTYNLAEVTDEEEFKIALTKLALGVSTPEGLNIFGKYLKGIILTNEDCLIFSENCNKDEFAGILSSLTNQSSYEKFVTAAYLKRLSMN